MTPRAGDIRPKLLLAALALSLLPLLAVPLAAQAEANEGFHLDLDPLTISYESVDVDTDSAKFNEYRDLEDGFLVEQLTLRGALAGGERRFRFDATRVGRSDARYALGYRQEGSWSIGLDLNRIPHNFGNDGHTLFERRGGARWEIADSTQAALQGAIARQHQLDRTRVNFAFLNGLLQPYLANARALDLGLQRDRTHAEFALGKASNLSWKLAIDHEDRSGTRPYGASFGFSNVTELPEPVDYQTTSGQLSGEWKGTRGGIQFGGRVSRFENRNDVMIWDNPFRLTDSTDGNAYTAPGAGSIAGSALGRATLAPDNDAAMLFLNGRGKAGTWTMHGNLSFTNLRQNSDLQAYTLNSAIRGIDHNGATFDATDPDLLPQQSADRKVDVLAFSGTATTPLGGRFDLALRARYYDYDNRSARVEFPGYVRFHGVWEPIPRITVPYAYDRTDLSADLGWNIGRGTRLGFVAGWREMNRTFREITDSSETYLRLDGGHRRGPLWLHGHFEVGERSTSAYRVEALLYSFGEAEAVTNLSALRKFDQAERDYTDGLVQADWALSESVDLTFGLSGRLEDYQESLFGLASDEIVRANAELNWRVGERGNLYLFANRSEREVVQRSRQSGATPSTNPLDNWQVTFDEVNDVAGLGVEVTLATRWRLDLSGSWSKSDGEADIFSPPGGTPNVAVGFDDYEDIELFAAVVDLDYKINERFGVGLGWRYEDYVTGSFINRGLANYLPGALLLNADNGNYQGDVFTLRLHLQY